MKTKEFNKLGDTCLRTEKQLSTYCNILDWLVSYKQNETHIYLKDVNQAFVNWCFEEQIYNYGKDFNFKNNRFNLIFAQFERWNVLKLDKSNNKEIIININFNNQSQFDTEKKIFYGMANNYLPFKELLKFIWVSNNNLLNVNDLLIAFSIWDGQDDFAELYAKGQAENIKTIAKKIIDKMNGNYDAKYSKENATFNFRKPPKYLKIYKKIFNKLKNSQAININDLEELADKKDSYLWKMFNKKTLKIDKKFLLEDLIKNLNNFINKPKEFLILFEEQKLKQLLLREYNDLFRRWMVNFGFISDLNFETLDPDLVKEKTNYENNIFTLNITNIKIQVYPYSKEDTIKNLKLINDNLFSKIKKDNKELSNVPNSTIAEYFVNLFYSYALKINACDFIKYSKTKVDNETLQPRIHAPGGRADFQYIDNNKLIIVETTIHGSVTEIINNEAYPISNHVKSLLLDESNNLNVNKKNFFVFFVYNKELLDTKNANQENFNEIKDKIFIYSNNIIQQYNYPVKFSSNIFGFNELDLQKSENILSTS